MLTESHPTSFRALFDAELGFVCRALRRHGVADRDLADACQETFLIVHRQLATFEARSSLRTWLYGIAVRVAIGQRRLARNTREQLPGELPEQDVPADQLLMAEHRQQLELVEQALRATSPERREVFALYELEGMTMREVAQALDIPENTALYRYYGARDDVRAHLLRNEQALSVPRAKMGGDR